MSKEAGTDDPDMQKNREHYVFKSVTPETAHLPKYRVYKSHHCTPTLCMKCDVVFRGYHSTAKLLCHLHEEHQEPISVSRIVL